MSHILQQKAFIIFSLDKWEKHQFMEEQLNSKKCAQHTDIGLPDN